MIPFYKVNIKGEKMKTTKSMRTLEREFDIKFDLERGIGFGFYVEAENGGGFISGMECSAKLPQDPEKWEKWACSMLHAQRELERGN
jgi:hypothetical protein